MRRAGFTLIELIVVIVLLGILAATVAPRLLSRDSFEPYAVRDQLVSALRQLQTMQMQDGSRCYRLVAEEVAGEKRFGIPEPDADCSNALSAKYSDNSENQSLVAFSSVTLTPAAFSIQFDRLGRPLADCAGGCDLLVGPDLTIKIESEGYIHAQ